jgi:hypothetical protein
LNSLKLSDPGVEIITDVDTIPRRAKSELGPSNPVKMSVPLVQPVGPNYVNSAGVPGGFKLTPKRKIAEQLIVSGVKMRSVRLRSFNSEYCGHDATARSAINVRLRA